MNSNELSERLTTVVSYIPEGSAIADIGSDHAYLPCYAVKKGKAARAIAGEVVEGPYQSAVRQVREDGLQDVIEVRKGNGLAVLAAGEVDVITIAGMGGPLIATILEEGKDKLPGVKRLVLQPNIGAHAIRRWLYTNGWELTGEEILEEDGKIYEILVAVPSTDAKPLEEVDELVGPFLKKQHSDVFQTKWKQEYAQWERILSSLEQAKTEEAEGRREELLQKMKMIKEVLAWENE